jgi:DNA-binding NarL/FixJ family response regulator
MSGARTPAGAGTPNERIDVMIVCRSELLILGLERLLSRSTDFAVRTYTKLPERRAQPEAGGEAEPRKRRGLRVAIMSDRQSGDVVAECERLLDSFVDEVVLLLSRPNVDHMLGCMGIGVRAFVMEGERPETLVSAVRSVARHETYVGQQTLDLLVDWLAERRSGEGRRKRDRDRDLLRLLAEGRSTSEIAEWMQLAPKTVRNRVSTLYRRLGVHSRAAAVRMAEERGLLDPRDEGRRALRPEDR